ncbi:MAG: hypothetical protein IJD29_04240, partial [Anaerotignum sp.]|nr:hypothetical protein [Anaerotignum sp.]
MKKFKKLLAGFMTLAMLVTMLPATVLAAEKEVATADAFADAIADAENNDIIKLTADITTTSAMNIAGKTLTLDLGNNELTIGVGDNKFTDETNLTIKNGTINITGLTVSGNAIFCLDEYEKTLVTTLTLENVDVIGDGYSSAYGVFYIGDSSVLNVIGGEWNLKDDAFSAGGVFKADAAAATLNITNTKMTLHNVRRAVTHATTTIKNANIAISGDADGVDAEMEHGFNRSALTIVDSTITMKDMAGRGITAENGAVSIEGNSTVTMENVQEATIQVNNGKTVMIAETATVTVDETPTIANGSIVGTVAESPKGSNSYAYTKEVDGYVRVWGEGGGNAKESFVLKLYSKDELIATTKLNNVGGIIDGDVYVTWNFFYPESNDEYWTTTWEAGHPQSAAQPTKVKLYIDGQMVAETAAKMSGADDVNPVVWRELGGVAQTDIVAEENGEFLIKNVDDLKAFATMVNAGNNFSGKTVKLAADIDLKNEEWTPIGNSTNKFQGTFDGQNHMISNLLITGNKSDVGLFGFTTNGEIKNLIVYNANVSGRLNVGAVAGTPYTTKYTNIKLLGHVEINGMSYVGGIGGKNAYANWTDITVNVDSTSYVKANSVENGTAYRTYVGGVIGFMGEGGHTFRNITSNINVIGSTCDIGGITGIAHYGNNFINVSCSGDVTTEADNVEDACETGGIAGVWNNGGAPV